MRLPRLEPKPFEPMVNDLLALCGETMDDELLEATRKLRDAAEAHDAADLLFVAAANEVQRILVGKLP